MAARITAIVVFVFTTTAGCMVVDEIEFTDKINHPPQLLTVEPSNESIEIMDTAKKDFGLTLWDPDEEDVALYEARIFLLTNPYTITEELQFGSCEVTELPQPEDDPGKYGTGVLMNVSCELNLETFLPSMLEDQIVLTKILVADRTFSQNVLPEEANSLEVIWTVELLVEE